MQNLLFDSLSFFERLKNRRRDLKTPRENFNAVGGVKARCVGKQMARMGPFVATHTHLACHRRRHGRNAVETRDERPHHEREASRCRNVSGDRERKRILNVKDAEHLKFAAARAERKRKREGCRVFAFLRSGFVALASQTFGFAELVLGQFRKSRGSFRQFQWREKFLEGLVALLDLSKGDADRITIRMASRFSCGGQPPMIATDGRYLFSKLTFCFDTI